MSAECQSPSLAFTALEGVLSALLSNLAREILRGEAMLLGSAVRYGWIQPACACLNPQAAAKGQALGESSPCRMGGAFGKILECSSRE